MTAIVPAHTGGVDLRSYGTRSFTLIIVPAHTGGVDLRR